MILQVLTHLVQDRALIVCSGDAHTVGSLFIEAHRKHHEVPHHDEVHFPAIRVLSPLRFRNDASLFGGGGGRVLL